MTMKKTIFKHLLVAATLTASFPAMAQDPVPVLSYGFESVAADDAGRFPAELHNQAMIVATADGNHVLSTGRTDGYMDLGASVSASVLSKLYGDYSISMDICVATDNALGRFCWAWAFSNGTGKYLGLVNAAGNGNWYYEIKDGSAQSVHTGKGLTADVWHNLTVVQEGATCTFYLDGVPVGTQTITLRPADFATGLSGNYLGRSPFDADAYMKNTLMDNFKVYDRALTSAQVEDLYAARPVSSETVLGVEAKLQLAREELYMARAASYIHNRLELPAECTYGSVDWDFKAETSASGSGTLTFDNGVFTVTTRGNEPAYVGTLQGTLVIDGISCTVFDEPLKVCVAPDDNAYGYLYCHMPNLVPETGTGTLVSQVITYALGTEADKGLVYTELNRGSSIIDGIGTALPWCRDAFLAKDTKRKCYYIVTTDLYGSLDNGTSMLGNYSIGMFRSYDLINWTYTRCDVKQYLQEHPVRNIYDNTGTRLFTADKVSRVWAPQIIFINGDAYIYYAVGNTDNGNCDHFYISRANDDFTGIISFQMLYGANTADNVLDADINYLETDGLYHMSYRDYAGNGILDITTADLLNPEWSRPVSSFQDGAGYEASSVFRRINDDVWNVGNVNYGSNVGFHFHTADALLRNLQAAPDLSGRLSPQHGSFVYVTETEYKLLQAWSDLKALIADAEALNAKVGSARLEALTARSRTDMTTDRGAATDLTVLCATLQYDVEVLGARLRYEEALQKAEKANFSGQEAREGDVDAAFNEGRLAAALERARSVADTGDADEADVWNAAADELQQALSSFYEVLSAKGEKVSPSNGTFAGGMDGWTVSGATAGTGNGVAEFFALRAVDYSVTMQQTLQDLKTGYYLVKCQAFERNGENDHSGRDCREGVELINYRMFAGTDTVALRSLYELPYDGDNSWYGFANGMLSANALFAASPSNFANYLLVYVDSGSLTVGLHRPVSTVHSSDWCCFDNFELYYMGEGTSVGEVRRAVQLPAYSPVYDLTGVRCGTTGYDGSLPASLPRGIYIVNGHKEVKY